MTTPEAAPNAQPLVVLAAGRSARMGRPKPLLPWRGATLLAHACEAALGGGADPVLVVAEDPPWLRDRAGAVGEVLWVSCPEGTQSQSASLQAGLTAALQAAATATQANADALNKAVGAIVGPPATSPTLTAIPALAAPLAHGHGLQRFVPVAA